MQTKSYRVSRFAEIEGNNVEGWFVYNIVTGIYNPATYLTYDDAKEAAQFVGTHYRSIERKAGW